VPLIFGILNLTPDSFSDGDRSIFDLNTALAKAQALIDAGANVLDIGAESTRPGAVPVSTEEEWKRLKPFLEAYNLAAPLSLDSRNPDIVKRALYHTDAIHYINDVSGMTNPELLLILEQHAESHLKFISMHSKGGVPPSQSAIQLPDNYYANEGGLYQGMKTFWQSVFDLSQKLGLQQNRFILDPGIGFGKNLRHSLELPTVINQIKQDFGLPVMIGASRKSFLKAWKTKEDASLQELDSWTIEYNELFDLSKDDALRLHLV
jgi:dihydropteroate synthase